MDVLHGVPVAVKVMTTEKARGARFRAMFDNEVRAMASLEHPCIAHVHDYGQIDWQASKDSEGRLVEGSSWLAMELAGAGTLAHLVRPQPWSRIRAILRALLDALAHAHARGVVHRDLKPANILICGPKDLRPGLKLADFGLAHPVEAATGSRRISAPPPPAHGTRAVPGSLA
ncbi:MAG: protein kinase [Proteobacteria bacterium]|nr:protein kinase [Pseudomonadota bacterium]